MNPSLFLSSMSRIGSIMLANSWSVNSLVVPCGVGCWPPWLARCLLSSTCQWIRDLMSSSPSSLLLSSLSCSLK
uniref:Uncharacterized protein n=1 Tax=Ixodes ricinus TaxID=34613 RepID=A0A6B0TT16_IXORI